MKASIHDVARAAEVSISTVSRVLNETGPFSDETRARVVRAAKALGYVPNASARSLKISQTRNIALLVRNITNPFFAPMLRVIEQQISLRGYPFMVESVEDGQDEMELAIRLAQEKKLCAVMMIGGTYNHTEAQFVQMRDVPTVLITFTAPESVPKGLYSSIIIDDAKEAHKAVSYLASLGHRDICYLAKSPKNPETTGHRRLLGYRRALSEYGIEYDPSLVLDCEYTASSGFSAMRRLLGNSRKVTAVFAASDTIATGAAKAILASGLRIPEDVSVIGFDGIEAAEYYHPALDTLVQPALDMARCGVDLLFDKLRGVEGTKHLVFEAALVKRGSTGVCDALEDS